MGNRRWLLGLFIAVQIGSFPLPVLAWDEGARGLYNNKMALLQVLKDGAAQRAADSGDVETLCLLLSIGNDVTERYLSRQPKDAQIRDRLKTMRRDLGRCLSLMQRSR